MLKYCNLKYFNYLFCVYSRWTRTSWITHPFKNSWPIFCMPSPNSNFTNRSRMSSSFCSSRPDSWFVSFCSHILDNSSNRCNIVMMLWCFCRRTRCITRACARVTMTGNSSRSWTWWCRDRSGTNGLPTRWSVSARGSRRRWMTSPMLSSPTCAWRRRSVSRLMLIRIVRCCLRWAWKNIWGWSHRKQDYFKYKRLKSWSWNFHLVMVRYIFFVLTTVISLKQQICGNGFWRFESVDWPIFSFHDKVGRLSLLKWALLPCQMEPGSDNLPGFLWNVNKRLVNISSKSESVLLST